MKAKTPLTSCAALGLAFLLIQIRLPWAEEETRRKRKKKSLVSFRLNEAQKVGDDLLSRWCTIIGVTGLTAEFGMGSGVTPSL